jgi:hypothetical protein
VEELPLHLRDNLPGVLFVPVPVQMLRHGAELDEEVDRQVLGFDLATLFLPKPQQRWLVLTHDDPGVRSADEEAAIYCHRFISKV